MTDENHHTESDYSAHVGVDNVSIDMKALIGVKVQINDCLPDDDFYQPGSIASIDYFTLTKEGIRAMLQFENIPRSHESVPISWLFKNTDPLPQN